MFKERYRQALLRIAKQLARPETLELSKEFRDLSRKTPRLKEGDTLLFIEMIKGAELYAKYPNNEDAMKSCNNVVTYLKANCA